MAKVALQQASSTDAGMQLISWHYVSDLGTQAKHQSKPVLLFFPGVGSAKSATMERTVLTNAIVAKLVVDAYYPVRVEERTAKDFELIKQLHLKYVIAQVPALLIASPGGSKLGMQVGAKSAAETYEFLRTAPTKPADDERRKTSEKVEDSEP
jgi:hypothetical protein